MKITVLVVSLAIAVFGASAIAVNALMSDPAPQQDKMVQKQDSAMMDKGGDAMKADESKMAGDDKMAADKMEADKMAADKMEADKMTSGDKMAADKMVAQPEAAMAK